MILPTSETLTHREIMLCLWILLKEIRRGERKEEEAKNYVYIVGKQAEDNIKTAWLPYKDESGKSSTQKVTVTSREEKFEIAGTGTAVFDFDKSLLAYKPDKMSKQTCFLTAVNTSTLLSPEKMKSFLGDTTVSDLPSNSSNHAEYMSSGVVVPNKDILSSMSKELCKDSEVIWMVPKPEGIQETLA